MAYRQATHDKDEPPGKQWRIEAESNDGATVILGRYDTKAGAESDFTRLADDEFYSNLRIVIPPDPQPPEPPAS